MSYHGQPGDDLWERGAHGGPRHARARDGEAAAAQAMFDGWASSQDVCRFLTWGPYREPDEDGWLEQVVASSADPTFYQWGIELRESSTLIGTIDARFLADISPDQARERHMGYCIGKGWWHQGYTSEALSAVIDLLFGEVGCIRVSSRHDVRNPRSGMVMASCGLTLEGMLRRSGVSNAGVGDMAWYGILREEWGRSQGPARVLRPMDE